MHVSLITATGEVEKCGLSDSFDPVCGVYIVSRSHERRALLWRGCRQERHGLECVESKLSMHVSSTAAMRKGEEMRSS